MDNSRNRKFEVEMSQDKMRLDEFLTHKISRLSRTQAQKFISAGAVQIEPFRLPKPALRVQCGDIVSLKQSLDEDATQYNEISIIFENADFWCFDKPAGMLVHPTARAYHNSVTVFVEKVLKQRPFVVHRLDKESSGLLIMAKSSAASKALTKRFVDLEIEKEYTAVVYDPLSIHYPGAHKIIDFPLGLAGIRLPNMTMGLGSQEALSETLSIKANNDKALLNLKLKTGRQHQLRVHLALIGTPIIGDKLYLFGESFYKDFLDKKPVPNYQPQRQLLHATRLKFEYQGIFYEFHSEIPQIFEHFLECQVDSSYLPSDYAKAFRKK